MSDTDTESDAVTPNPNPGNQYLHRTTLRIIDPACILIEERQRKTLNPVKLTELEQSILATGLINPVVVQLLPEPKGPFTHRLVAGERRLTVMKRIHSENKTLRFASQTILAPSIPAVEIGPHELSLHLMKIELAENIFRDDLSWQDRDRALYTIHQLEVAGNPVATITSTARMLAERGGMGTTKAESSFRKAITQASVVATHLDDSAVASARNSNEAFNIIMQREEAAINAEIHRRQVAITQSKPETQRIQIIHGDAFKVLPTLNTASFDLILSDPPYGVNAGAKGFRERTVHHHNYSDTPEDAMNAIKLLLTEGWRLTKATANLFVFSGIDHFPFFKSQAAAMGWKPYPVPMIWRKSLSEGLAPWGRSGPRRTYDPIFFATKGQRGLFSSPTDVLEVKRVHRSERIYGAQKPVDLLMQLIECSTMPGMAVLDPFAGSGSTLAAAKKLDRLATGVEFDKSVADIATNFVFKSDLDTLATDNDEPDTDTPLSDSDLGV